MPEVKLTAEVAEAARYEGNGKAAYVLWDQGNPSRLGLRVYPSGRKTWVVGIPTKRGGSTMRALAAYTPKSLRIAKERAAKVRQAVDAGSDPFRAKTERRTRTADLLLELRDTRDLNGKGVRDWDRRSERIAKAFPRLAAFDRASLKQWFEESTGEYGPAEANVMLKIVRALLRRAHDRGIIRRIDFLSDVRPNPQRKRSYEFRSDAVERFFEACDSADALGRWHPSQTLLVRCLYLTGCRRDELRLLRVDSGELRLAERKIVLPPERHKTGKRTQKPRVVYLSQVAVEWFQRALARMVPGNPHVFPGVEVGKPISKSMRVWEWIRREAGLPENFVLHGTRHLRVTRLGAAGVDPIVAARTVGHDDLDTHFDYRHLFDGSALAAQEAADRDLLTRAAHLDPLAILHQTL